MTAEGAHVQPGGAEIPFQPRAGYAGYRAFGSGDGAVLVEPGLAHQLRSAAELATQLRRCTGGLVFGRRWVDDQGGYLVVSGYVEAGPDANSGERDSSGSRDDFTLSATELGLLREDAAAIYSASYEVGWWRTLAALGEFGAGDLATQAELAASDGVGLLVYGSGIHWGTAYLGPDGRAPDSAGTLVVAPGLDAEPPAGPEPALAPDPAADPLTVPAPGPEVVDIAAGESLLDDGSLLEEEPLLSADFIPPQDAAPETAAPGRAGRRVRPAAGQAGRRVRPAAGQARQRLSSRVRVPTRARARARARAGRPVDAGYPDAGGRGEAYPGQGLPADAQLVVVALAVAAVAAAVIVGFLVHSVIVAVIIAAVGLLAIAATVWFTPR